MFDGREMGTWRFVLSCRRGIWRATLGQEASLWGFDVDADEAVGSRSHDGVRCSDVELKLHHHIGVNSDEFFYQISTERAVFRLVNIQIHPHPYLFTHYTQKRPNFSFYPLFRAYGNGFVLITGRRTGIPWSTSESLQDSKLISAFASSSRVEPRRGHHL